MGSKSIMKSPMTEKVLSMMIMIQWTILNILRAPNRLKTFRMMIKVYIWYCSR
jgi:hypothetical protein